MIDFITGLGIIIPPLLYVMIIYLTSPIGTVNLKTSMKFLLSGISSIFIVYLIYMMFPGLANHNDAFINTFMLIAPREEIAKMLMFYGTLYFATKNEKPVSIMLYCGIVGLGFAMFENIQYTKFYGIQTLIVRTFTSTLGHMLFGMFMGYWVARGRIKESIFNQRSVFSVVLHKYQKIRRVIYSIIGFLSAITLHGLWNYNLSVAGGYPNFASSPIMITILIFGLIGGKYAMKDLYNIDRQSKRK